MATYKFSPIKGNIRFDFKRQGYIIKNAVYKDTENSHLL